MTTALRTRPAAPRASPAAHPIPRERAAEPFLIEMVSRDRYAGLADAWAGLARRALEPNALMTPEFAIAALNHLADIQRFEVVAIWRRSASGALLVGIMVLKADSRRWGPGFRLAETMAHNYGPLGTPLFDSEHGAAAAAALLTWLRSGSLARVLLFMPFLNESGPTAAMLRQVLKERGLRHRAFERFERALAAPVDKARYIDTAMPAKRRRELARLRRRLDVSDDLRHMVAVTAETVPEAVEAFLALEAAGWKGRAGTASTQRPDRLRFVKAAMTAMALAGTVRVHVLSKAGVPIAAGIALVSANRAWFWKIAYDEAFAAFSPGVQLAVAVTDDLFGVPGIESIDSLADADHPMIDHLWREHLTMAHWLIDLTPHRSIRYGLAGGLEGLRRRARQGLVALRDRLRRRR